MLTDLQLERTYETTEVDIAKEFYIPCLNESIIYKRVAGYFSSSSLAYFSKGLESLYKSNGKYYLIISNEISEEDYNLIKKGYHLKTNIDEKLKEIQNEYKELSDQQKADFSNLAYLISIGFVEIKVGFSYNGLFHSKFGLFRDKDGNRILFSGSNNETEAAFKKNYESFMIVESWTSERDRLTIEEQEFRFDKMWNKQTENSLIFIKEFNEIIKSEIIKYSKGELVLDPIFMKEDALILYYSNNKLKIKDNLKGDKTLYEKRHFRRIKDRYLNNEIFWDFKSSLNYKDIEDIIERLQKASNRFNFNLEIADTVYEYIEAQKFDIDSISRLGLMIKNKDIDLAKNFQDFMDIVNKETNRPLREIQMWVSYFMTKMKRVGNFSVPGSGKTAMVYGTYAYLSSPGIDEVNKIIVVGPKNSFKSWKDEFKNVFGQKRELSVLDIHAPNFSEEMLVRHTSNYNLFLINYESLSKYRESLLKLVDSKTMLVYDEVHRVKGLKSVRAQEAIEISQGAKFKYLLTGTPLPNGYQDLWNTLQILFKNEYREYFNITKSELQNISLDKIEKFNDDFFPFYWRVTKNELGVPKAEPDTLIVSQMTPEEQAVVDLLWRKYKSQPFVLYARLVQFSSNPKLLKRNLERALFINDDDDGYERLTFEYDVDQMYDIPSYSEQDITIIDRVKTSTKFKKAIETSSNLIKQNKVIIIWCIFIDTMYKVKEELMRKGFRVAIVYGGVSAFEREQIITDYQNGMYDVLITNPHTLGESVSLHNIAHDALYLEYSFNLTHMLQSRDRIHRLGLKDTDKTNYYYFLLEGNDEFRNTIDRKIYERLKEKEDVMLEAIESTHIGVEAYVNERDEILRIMESDS